MCQYCVAKAVATDDPMRRNAPVSCVCHVPTAFINTVIAGPVIRKYIFDY